MWFVHIKFLRFQQCSDDRIIQWNTTPETRHTQFTTNKMNVLLGHFVDDDENKIIELLNYFRRNFMPIVDEGCKEGIVSKATRVLLSTNCKFFSRPTHHAQIRSTFYCNADHLHLKNLNIFFLAFDNLPCCFVPLLLILD